MPGMDGLEFCRQIKAHLLTAHIPVVFATALVEETDKMDGLRAGADAYINKPFEREELSLIIGNLLV